jgi:hypothetical protein
MTKAPDELLALRIGATSVGENLRRAVESGRLTEADDGTLQVAKDPKQEISWMYVDYGPPLGCGFLIDFMFQHAYTQSAVPDGCSACYKVKVVPRTLRELVAAWEIGKRIHYRSKWGTDLNNPSSQNIYAGYFYTKGLDGARTIFKVVREAINEDPKLGPDIPMTINRRCSEYEAMLEPSDRYEFTPGMAELETYLKTKFRERKADYQPSMVAAHWIETAFRIGDDSYLDFTGGKRLRQKTMTYNPAWRRHSPASSNAAISGLSRHFPY